MVAAARTGRRGREVRRRQRAPDRQRRRGASAVTAHRGYEPAIRSHAGAAAGPRD